MKKKPDTRTTKKEEDFRFGVFTEDYLIRENLIRKRLTGKRSSPRILPLHRPKRKKEEWTLVDGDLVGRCRLCCGACSIHGDHKDDDEYLKLLAEYFKCPPEKCDAQDAKRGKLKTGDTGAASSSAGGARASDSAVNATHMGMVDVRSLENWRRGTWKTKKT